MTLQRLEDLLETAYRTGTAEDWAAYQAARRAADAEPEQEVTG